MSQDDKLYNLALDGLIPLMNYCNNPKTIKPYGIPSEIHKNLANIIQSEITKAVEEATKVEMMPHTLYKMRKHIKSQCADELEEYIAENWDIHGYLNDLDNLIKRWRNK